MSEREQVKDVEEFIVEELKGLLETLLSIPPIGFGPIKEEDE